MTESLPNGRDSDAILPEIDVEARLAALGVSLGELREHLRKIGMPDVAFTESALRRFENDHRRGREEEKIEAERN